MSPPPPRARLALAEISDADGSATFTADLSYPSSAPTSPAVQSAASAGGAQLSPEGGMASTLASFVEVDAAKRNVLECMPYAEHHVLLWESNEVSQ